MTIKTLCSLRTATFSNEAYTKVILIKLQTLFSVLRKVILNSNYVFCYHKMSCSQVSRLQFKRMVNSEFAQIMSLHAGEAYAMQNLTRTDRLGLLLSGKVSLKACKDYRLRIREICHATPVIPKYFFFLIEVSHGFLTSVL